MQVDRAAQPEGVRNVQILQARWMMKCEECKFYKERHFQYNGWCRRYPPICDRKLELCTWPTISYDGWCGMFEPAEPEPQPAPQFDAENVEKILRILDGNIDGAQENEDDCGDLFFWSARTCVHELRKALGIE